jgi:hypothetical protein
LAIETLEYERYHAISIEVSGVHIDCRYEALSGPLGERKRFLLCKVA